MEPAALSPLNLETDAPRAAVAAEMGAARRAAIIAAKLRALFTGLSALFIARHGIEGTTTHPPHRSPAHCQLDRRYQSQGGLVRRIFPGPDDTAPRSEGRDATSDRGRDDTTRTAHTTTPQGEARDSNEAPAFAAVIGLLAYVSCVVIGLLTEFEHTVAGWGAAAKVSYGLLVLVTASLLGFGVMASVAGSSTMLRVSDLCARLGAILCTALLIVAFSCKMGKPWGCAAGVPFAAVVACAMGAIGIWGRARALWDRFVGPRRQRQPPGGGDANV